ncbi:NAD(P)-dependent alcohol dehydrogenase [Actinophytocola algeriensis]|uniref:NADPH:quinone reductase-like Zn-dependent oxidoreductase n=1 Tax=Actinophytocola algeriensis TaxID=1768010 RepID=A0A7W7VCV8_9PSEU|nr:NAD(P)-dependent alcohol dehydrogenase [Actinophytocola algeriensis]MBB4905502.1 NADPH:quinone reductase-like Zn-dependent oxidoreductase [Actinophytocola algeriensis]MBE1472813.1 NADPH:quinone reductase-like Zn-dependent oxidoreductase [Actinophytocola algeriensis]
MARDDYSGPEGLELRDMDTPAPRQGEVLVRVRAAGVDQGAWHVLTGLPYAGRLAFGLRRPRAKVVGMDVAGVVEAVGAGVTALRPGDEVFGICRGAFAEYACGKAKTLLAKPENLTFEQAAAVPVSACTALTALRGVVAGQRVLVIGAGGGVGSYAVQLATASGADVTGVCSTSKVDFVRSLGAVAAIDYTKEPLTGQYNMLLDIAGNRPISVLRALVTPHGTLVAVGGESGGRWLAGLERNLAMQVRNPFTRQKLRAPISIVRPADLAELSALLADGKITPAVDRTYALGDLPAAITDLRDRRVRGKIVVVP